MPRTCEPAAVLNSKFETTQSQSLLVFLLARRPEEYPMTYANLAQAHDLFYNDCRNNGQPFPDSRWNISVVGMFERFSAARDLCSVRLVQLHGHGPASYEEAKAKLVAMNNQVNGIDA